MNADDAFKLLLEEIAFRLSPQNVEKKEFLETLYASQKRETTEVHGDVRSQGPSTEQVPEPQSGTRIQSQAKWGVFKKPQK